MESYSYEGVDIDYSIYWWAYGIPLIIVVINMIISWKIFVKAGQPGWASLIPIYNIFVLLQIIGKPWWWFFMFFIPSVNVVFVIWATNLFCKSFGKDFLWTIGMFFISFILLAVIAFGDSKYLGPAGKHFRMEERY